jgi:hypothetical protein
MLIKSVQMDRSATARRAALENLFRELILKALILVTIEFPVKVSFS